PARTLTSTLSLHDALPICARRAGALPAVARGECAQPESHAVGVVLALLRGPDGRVHPALLERHHHRPQDSVVTDIRTHDYDVVVDRKSTRLNSSHLVISYA